MNGKENITLEKICKDSANKKRNKVIGIIISKAVALLAALAVGCYVAYYIIKFINGITIQL